MEEQKSVPWKDDNDKTRLDLIPPEFLEEMGKVMTHGAKIYGADNWKSGMRWGRVYAAAFRHMNAWRGGETLDPKSGLSHLAHAACCMAFLISYSKRNVGVDDINS